MQPHPSIFLRGILRELRLHSAGRDSGGGAAWSMVLPRIESTLARLIVSRDHLSEIESQTRQQLAGEIDATLRNFHKLGIALPDSLAFESLEGLQTSALTAALADCIKILSRHVGTRPDLRGVLQSLIESALDIEKAQRDSYEACLSVTENEKLWNDASASDRPWTTADVARLLREQCPGSPDARVGSLRRLTGLHGHDAYFADIFDCADWPIEVVIKRDRGFKPTEASLTHEYPSLKLVYDAGLPVPRPLFMGHDPEDSNRVVRIDARVPGKEAAIDKLGAQGRILFRHLAELQAQLHAIDIQPLDRTHLASSLSPREGIIKQIEAYYTFWRHSEPEPSPTMEAAFAWLFANVDRAGEHRALVHGDFNQRNVLVDGDRITAILDWEHAHLGNPAEDLAHTRAHVEHVMDWLEYMDVYRAHGGRDLGDEVIHYFEVYSQVLGNSYCSWFMRSYLRGLHDNFVFGTCGLKDYEVHIDRLHELLRSEKAR